MRKSFLKDQSGATAVEYALIAALIVLVAATGIQTLSTGTGGSINDTSNKISTAMQGGL